MPQPDRYSIIAVANSVQGLEEIGTRVVNNDKYTPQRIEDFLNDADSSYCTLQSQNTSALSARRRRVDVALMDFDEAFGWIEAKI
ncbi:hypothetical protein EG329_013311 [Mollisiaceae sp. DMI_Dod_QoI]|nr:hypothetical protein EG329_013311 [Helotiales sp. DMI_Dod_QoI]